MKKLILLLLGVAIGFAICYFMPSLENATEENATKEASVKPPKGIITPGQGEALDRAFNSRHTLISDSIVKRPDNRSSWYSLQTMRDFLTYAEVQTKDMGYTMDGVRIYLGAYPNKPDGVGYTTMFLMPTGTQNVSEGSMISFAADSGDIPGASGLNLGGQGDPPNANYPNN